MTVKELMAILAYERPECIVKIRMDQCIRSIECVSVDEHSGEFVIIAMDAEI